MLKMLKNAFAMGSVIALGAMVGCSSDDDTDAGVADAGTLPRDAGTNADAGQTGCPTEYGTFAGALPECTVEISFSIDDTANKVYAATDGLAWKGSFTFNADTRILTRDPSWGGGSGPYPLLYDDGPWNMGGHEASNATAGDNIWTVAVFYPVPAEETPFEYGAVRNWAAGSQGDWIWQGSNGAFTVPANADAPVRATGLTLAAFGTTDLRFFLNTSNSTITSEFPGFNPANGVRVKSSGWGWTEVDMVDNGMDGDATASDGIFTFVMSENIGAGNPLRLSGLFKSGDEVQFVFVLGGVEYKVGGAPPTAGVTAAVRAMGAQNWTDVVISNKPDGDRNTFVTVP